MPHAGGGSGGGGGSFHSSSSGTSSSTPKYDHNGRRHSTYYMRPGFYYHGLYVPYGVRRRRSTVLMPYFICLFISIIFALIAVFCLKGNGEYSGDKLEEYALKQYSEVYNPSSAYYEENILVTIVAYESNDQYDYISIVGDNLATVVDYSFGNQNTKFGAQIAQNISYTNYYSTLYTNLAKSVEAIIDDMPTGCVLDNPSESKIINKTSFGDIEGENALIEAEAKFFAKTGYRISFLITSNEEAYELDYVGFGICAFVSLALVLFGVYGICKGNKAVNEVNNAIKNGNGKAYFEGEDDFDVYRSQNSDIEY